MGECVIKKFGYLLFFCFLAITASAQYGAYGRSVFSCSGYGIVYTNGTVPPAPTSDLVLDWFGVGSSSSIAIDQSGNNHTGDVSVATWSAGVETNGLSYGDNYELNGSSGRIYMNSGNPASIYNNTNITYRWLVKLDDHGESNSGRQLTIGTGTTSPGGYFQAYVSYFRIHIFYSGTDSATRTVNPVPLNQWVWITVVHNGATKKSDIYYNEVKQSLSVDIAGTGTIDNDSAAVMSVGNDITGSRTMDGIMPEFKIFATNHVASWVASTTQVDKVTLGIASVQTTPPVFEARMSGGALANDGSTNSTTITWTDEAQGDGGITNGFVVLNGVSTVGETTVDASATASESFTICMWARRIYDAGTVYMYGAIEQQGGSPAATDPVTDIRVEADGAVRFRIRGDGSSNMPEATTGVSPVWGTDNVWHHIACVRDVVTDKITVYIDGVFNSEATDTTVGTIDLSSTPPSIGASNIRGVNAGFWDGVLDEVKRYDSALSSNSITSMQEAESGLVGQAPYYESIPQKDSIVGFWTFNGALTGKSQDWANYGRNGLDADDADVAKSVATRDWTGNGVSSESEIPNATLVDGNSAITLAVWINTDAQTAYDGILVSKGSDNLKLSLGSSSGKVLIQLDVGTSAVAPETTGTPIPNNGTWYHVVATWTSGEAPKIYVNGVVQALSSATTLTGTLAQDDNFRIGYDDGNSARHFAGSIDDALIFNTAYTAPEVAELYSLGHP